jgi:hypothetical protein
MIEVRLDGCSRRVCLTRKGINTGDCTRMYAFATKDVNNKRCLPNRTAAGMIRIRYV